MKVTFLFLIYTLTWLFSGNLFAKNMDFGYLEIEVDKEAGTVLTRLDYNPTKLGNPLLPFHTTLGKSFWKMGGANCQWRNTKNEIIAHDQAIVSATAICPEIKSVLALDLALFFRAPVNYKILGRVINDGEETLFISTLGQRVVRIVPKIDKSFSHFVYLGAESIGVSPKVWISQNGLKFPAGIDHILFIAALVITGGSFFQTAKSIMGFTLGHSLTLILATLGILTIPHNLVEPAIALSIIFVAAEGSLKQRPTQKFLLSLIFGLVHGFAFASVLVNYQTAKHGHTSALVGFNLGIELGQLFVILMIVPIIYLIKRYSIYQRTLLRSSSLGVLILGVWWFVERTAIL